MGDVSEPLNSDEDVRAFLRARRPPPEDSEWRVFRGGPSTWGAAMFLRGGRPYIGALTVITSRRDELRFRSTPEFPFDVVVEVVERHLTAGDPLDNVAIGHEVETIAATRRADVERGKPRR